MSFVNLCIGGYFSDKLGPIVSNVPPVMVSVRRFGMLTAHAVLLQGFIKLVSCNDIVKLNPIFACLVQSWISFKSAAM